MAVIKPDAIQRADLVDARMGWPRGLALGRMIILWENTQTGKGMNVIPKRLVEAWASVPPIEIDAFIAAALEVHFFEKKGTDLAVVGNQKHVDNIAAYKAGKVAGGKASGKARRLKIEQDTNRTGTDGEQVFEQNANGNEPSSSSFSSSSSSTSSGPPPALGAPPPDKDACAYDPPHPADSPSAAPPAAGKAQRPAQAALAIQDSAPGTDGSRVWSAYAMAYVGVYKHAPARNQKQNALCKQLVQRLGVSDAEAVVRFYLTHRGNWYVQKCHQLEYAVKDAEALRTQMAAGVRVTSEAARRVDNTQTNEQTFAAVREKRRLEREANGG